MGFAGRDFNIAGKSKYNTGSSGSYTGRGSDFADSGRVYEGSDNEASGKKDSGKKDSGKKDNSKKESGKNDTSKKDNSKKDTSKRDSEEKDTSKKDSEKKDASKKDCGDKRTIRPYNRDRAVQYAHLWAYGRNPSYYDFEKLGGDCTNFASQCIYAGSGVMNYTPVYGWYYINSFNRTASWTGVNYLYKFLVNNRGAGPFAEEVDISDVRPGDIAQLSFADSKHFNHSPVVVKVSSPPSLEGILVAAHTFDTDYYRLADFEPAYVRFLHIAGVRV